MVRRSSLLALILVAGAACSSSSKKAAPPSLTSVGQAALCTGGGALLLHGKAFQPGAAVLVATGGAGTRSSQVDVSADGTAATAHFTALPAGGPYDVTLTNPDGQSSTLAAAIRVVPNPQLFYVDPSVVWNGIGVQATIYGSGFNEPVTSVSIAPTGGGSPVSLTFTEDPARPNQVQALVPAGMAAGTYDVVLGDSYCSGTLSAGLTVTDQVSLALGAVSPAQGWTGSSNAVAVAATGGSTFAPVPRVYLSPSASSSSTTSSALGAVSLVDATDLTALVPAGLPVGSYDVIVVNPDGKVGVATAAYHVLKDPPPSIASLAPGSLPTGSLQPFTINGANFRTPAVTLTCTDGTGAATAAPSVTVVSSTATAIAATVSTAGTTAVACAVTVTDADLSFAEYSALVFTNPAQNLYLPVAGPALSTPRRAPVTLGGDATATARFLHVIGGDDGAGKATGTVESVPLSLLGAPGAYAPQRTQLVQPRAFAGGALIGRFMYVAGGSNGGAALDSVERAAVLDPANRGQLTGVVLAIDKKAGVDAGLWYYRVAAVLDATDPVNPRGENLPSDPFPVQLPQLTGAKLDVTLTWAVVPHAARYRVYRSPTAGAAVGTEQVIAEVAAPATSFTDDGSAAVVSTDTPLPVGSLGAWSTVAHLSTPREGPGVSWGVDPADPTKAYLYVAGGRSNATTALASIELLPIALNADGTQTVAAAFQPATTSLSAARWQLGASQATAALSPSVGGTTYVYALSGLSAAGAIVPNAEAAAVQAGGQLSAMTALSQVHRAGYGMAVAGNFVFAFGGAQGVPSPTIDSGQICGSGVLACTSGQVAPNVANFNSNGVQMLTPRYLAGTTLSGAYIYVTGGESVAGAPPTLTTSTEYFLW